MNHGIAKWGVKCILTMKSGTQLFYNLEERWSVWPVFVWMVFLSVTDRNGNAVTLNVKLEGSQMDFAAVTAMIKPRKKMRSTTLRSQRVHGATKDERKGIWNSESFDIPRDTVSSHCRTLRWHILFLDILFEHYDSVISYPSPKNTSRQIWPNNCLCQQEFQNCHRTMLWYYLLGTIWRQLQDSDAVISITTHL